jgi:hypothetical protein
MGATYLACNPGKDVRALVVDVMSARLEVDKLAHVAVHATEIRV